MTALLPALAPVIIVACFYFALSFIICLLLKIFNPGLFSRFTYQVSHWGIYKKNEQVDYSSPWRNIISFKETKSWLLLYISEGSALVIEKKTFPNKQELEALSAFIKSKTSG